MTLANEHWYARHVGTVVMSQVGPLEGHRTMMPAVRFEMRMTCGCFFAAIMNNISDASSVRTDMQTLFTMSEGKDKEIVLFFPVSCVTDCRTGPGSASRLLAQDCAVAFCGGEFESSKLPASVKSNDAMNASTSNADARGACGGSTKSKSWRRAGYSSCVTPYGRT